MSEFIDRPGSPGAFGALMDEYARAAGAFCTVLEAFDRDAFEVQVPSEDPDTTSVRSIAEHVVRAAFGYAADLRQALASTALVPEALDSEARVIDGPADVRPALAAALRHTEAVGESLRTATSKEVMGNTFRMRWGQLYDPEILLEHAIVHPLRHRRQLERWRVDS